MLKIFISTLVLLSFPSVFASKDIDTAKSSVEWTGKKLTGSHHGTVKIVSGKLDIAKKQAEVVVDMDSINVVDLEGEWKDKLMNHLRSEDFFSVKSFKNATLKINNMEKTKSGTYKATGTLTIKDKTQPVNFEVKEDKGQYSGKLTFDRTQFDIKYRSGKFFENLGDKLIHDEVTLEFKIATK